jgi:hypothetical protein
MRSALEIIPCCKIICPPTKLQVFSVLSRFISARLFSFPQLAEIQDVVTDEIKKVQEERFSAAFHKLYDRANVCVYVCMYASGAYLNNNVLCLPYAE